MLIALYAYRMRSTIFANPALKSVLRLRSRYAQAQTEGWRDLHAEARDELSNLALEAMTL